MRVGEQAVGANNRGAVHVFQRVGVVSLFGYFGYFGYRIRMGNQTDTCVLCTGAGTRTIR